MEKFETRERSLLHVDVEYEVTFTTTRSRYWKQGELKFKNETLHYDLECLIDEITSDENWYLEFVYKEVRFLIGIFSFGDIESTEISLTPLVDGKLLFRENQREIVHTHLKSQDIGAFTSDLFFLLKESEIKRIILNEVFSETPSNICDQEIDDIDKLMQLNNSCDLGEFGFDVLEEHQDLSVKQIQDLIKNKQDMLIKDL